MAETSSREAYVGVVVPVHGTQRWVVETLDSVRRQTHPRWFCVVVDDGSPDDAAEVVRQAVAGDPRFVVVSQPNAGVSAARNTGLRLLPAEVTHVAFLDSDDVWEADALEVLVDALDRRPDAGGVTATAELCDEVGAPLEPGAHPAVLRARLGRRGCSLRLLRETEDTDAASLAVAGRIFPPAVALLRKEVVDLVGGFAPDLVVSEDWHLFARVALQAPLVFLDRPVARYRRHGASATAQSFPRVTYYNDVVRRRLYDEAPTASARQQVVAGWRAVQLAALWRVVRLLLQEMRSPRMATLRWRARPVVELGRTLLRRSPPQPEEGRAHLRLAMVEVVQPGAVRGTRQRRPRTSS